MKLLKYVCQVKSAIFQRKIRKLQTIYNTFLRITLKTPEFISSKQLNNDIKISYLNNYIIDLLKIFHTRLNLTEISTKELKKNSLLKTCFSQNVMLFHHCYHLINHLNLFINKGIFCLYLYFILYLFFVF